MMQPPPPAQQQQLWAMAPQPPPQYYQAGHPPPPPPQFYQAGPPPPAMWGQPPPQAAPVPAPAPAPSGGAGGDEARTLWIGDLQYWMDENYLYSCFSQAGEVMRRPHLPAPYFNRFSIGRWVFDPTRVGKLCVSYVCVRGEKRYF